MKTCYLNDCSGAQPSCIATIGFFDGVHRGHQFLLRQLVEEARVAGRESAVITFDRHPRQVLHEDFRPQLLTTFDEKLRLLAHTGIDRCIVLPFTRVMAALSARDFMQQVLHDRLNVGKLYIGYDHRFGHQRTEGFADYVQYGQQLGILVAQSEEFTQGGSPDAQSSSAPGLKISSSQIRRHLNEGRVEAAAMSLGYPYFLCGTVVSGVQEGRRLGFPTANLQPNDACKLIPAAGVYAVRVLIDNECGSRPAMMNIGTRPTYGQNVLTLEVNILHFNGNLYGRRLTVDFHRRLREERRFESPEQLRRQLVVDARRAAELLSSST